MTQHEKRLAALLARQMGRRTADREVERLFERGLVNLRACEELLICEHLDRLQRRGIPRCEAMHAAAGELCCSYEKVRGAFYKHQKTRT